MSKEKISVKKPRKLAIRKHTFIDSRDVLLSWQEPTAQEGPRGPLSVPHRETILPNLDSRLFVSAVNRAGRNSEAPSALRERELSAREFQEILREASRRQQGRAFGGMADVS